MDDGLDRVKGLEMLLGIIQGFPCTLQISQEQLHPSYLDRGIDICILRVVPIHLFRQCRQEL